MTRKTLDERFWEKVEICGEDECWEWKSDLMNTGYGEISYKKADGRFSKKAAHRLSYEIHYGEIPEGMFACHSCDNRKCVNPKHLFSGTREENTRDMMEKRRQARGTKNSQNKLSENDVLYIRNSNEETKALSSRFGVSLSMVYYIKKGHSWSWLK